MTNTVIKTVQDIEHDFGSVRDCPDKDPRLKLLHEMYSESEYKPEPPNRSDRLYRAQQLLDNSSLPKYKIAERAGYNKDYFGTLCADGYLDDSKWYARRKNIHQYKYFRDNKLIAKGTINQISNLTGKSPSTLRGCTLSSYKKYQHKHTFKLVRVS